LPESGNEHIFPHKEFRIFACMNPPRLPMPAVEDNSATEKGSADPAAAQSSEGANAVSVRAGHSAGKKELPPGIRARFTEIFVDEVHTVDDVGLVVRSYLERDFPSPPVNSIVAFYSKATELCRQCALLDGAGKVAYFSLRNLTRALRFAVCLMRRPHYGSPGIEALAQGLAVGFATPLDPASAATVESFIEEGLGVSTRVRHQTKATGTSGVSAAVQVNEEKVWVKV